MRRLRGDVDLRDVVGLTGLALVATGLAAISVPLAAIVIGLVLLLVALVPAAWRR